MTFILYVREFPISLTIQDVEFVSRFWSYYSWKIFHLWDIQFNFKHTSMWAFPYENKTFILCVGKFHFNCNIERVKNLFLDFDGMKDKKNIFISRMRTIKKTFKVLVNIKETTIKNWRNILRITTQIVKIQLKGTLAEASQFKQITKIIDNEIMW